MTPSQLAELRALCEGATPGPWSVDEGDDERDPCVVGGASVAGHDIVIATISEWAGNGAASFEWSRPDAAFIVAARSALPALLAHVEALDAEVAALVGNLKAELARLRKRMMRKPVARVTGEVIAVDGENGIATVFYGFGETVMFVEAWPSARVDQRVAVEVYEEE